MASFEEFRKLELARFWLFGYLVSFNHGFYEFRSKSATTIPDYSRTGLRVLCYWENEEKETTDYTDDTDFFTTPAFAGAGSEPKKHEEKLDTDLHCLFQRQ